MDEWAELNKEYDFISGNPSRNTGPKARNRHCEWPAGRNLKDNAANYARENRRLLTTSCGRLACGGHVRSATTEWCTRRSQGESYENGLP
jgi:hypothetical protein